MGLVLDLLRLGELSSVSCVFALEHVPRLSGGVDGDLALGGVGGHGGVGDARGGGKEHRAIGAAGGDGVDRGLDRRDVNGAGGVGHVRCSIQLGWLATNNIVRFFAILYNEAKFANKL